MSTPTDSAVPPTDVIAPQAGNMPERCNTRIIDPDLLADFLPPSSSSDELIGPATISDLAPSSLRPTPSDRRPVDGTPVPTDEGSVATTLVVAYAPRSRLWGRSTLVLALLATAAVAVGVGLVRAIQPASPPPIASTSTTAGAARATMPTSRIEASSAVNHATSQAASSMASPSAPDPSNVPVPTAGNAPPRSALVRPSSSPGAVVSAPTVARPTPSVSPSATTTKMVFPNE